MVSDLLAQVWQVDRIRLQNQMNTDNSKIAPMKIHSESQEDSVNKVTPIKADFSDEFLVLYQRLQNRKDWANIAREFNSPKITRGQVYKLIKDKWEPRRNDLRIAFGLPALVSVPACPHPGCTDPHQHKHDEAAYTPATQEVFPLGQAAIKRKSVAKVSKPRRKRNAIPVDDMDSAFGTITNQISFANIVYLTGRLQLYVHMHPDELARYEAAISFYEMEMT